MAKTYLVTGGCGFIGSHLCEAIIASGACARVLDDLSTGSLANLPPRTRFIQGDIRDPSIVETAMNGVDGCFHLAAITSVERSAREWVNTNSTNLSGTIVIFDTARRVGKKGPIPVVYASSAAVYGDCKRLPIREAVRPQPLSAYGADKYACELHARVAAHVHGVPTVGLRFFNVYGPRQDPHSPYAGVISIFGERILAGQPIDIFGDGLQTRDFVYVHDVVVALMMAMSRAKRRPAVFNVCTGAPTSVHNLAHLIGQLCEVAPEISFRPARRGEIIHSLGDGSLIRRRFGLSNATALSDGMKETLAWMRDRNPSPTRSAGVIS